MLLGVAVPEAADAKTYRGKTSQRRNVSVIAGADGLPQRVRIGWRAPCRSGDHYYKNITRFVPPFDTTTPDLIRDGRTRRERDRGGIRARVSLSLEGARVVDPATPETERWEGRLAVAVAVYRHGRRIDTCRLKRLRWSARVVPGASR
jgi:hypothetical protein